MQKTGTVLHLLVSCLLVFSLLANVLCRSHCLPMDVQKAVSSSAVSSLSCGMPHRTIVHVRHLGNSTMSRTSGVFHTVTVSQTDVVLHTSPLAPFFFMVMICGMAVILPVSFLRTTLQYLRAVMEKVVALVLFHVWNYLILPTYRFIFSITSSFSYRFRVSHQLHFMRFQE